MSSVSSSSSDLQINHNETNGKSDVTYDDNDDGSIEQFVDDESSEGKENEDDQDCRSNDGSSQEENIPHVEVMKIKFDILSSGIVQAGRTKYTTYTILVMEMSTVDEDQALIERRYSQFYQLHRGLRKECPAVMNNITFPKKKLFSKKFENQVVEDRTRSFEKYLRYVYHQPGVVETKTFQNFFYKPHLKQATQHLKCEAYEESYEDYRLALQLQKKLGADQSSKITSMCGIVETSKNLKQYARAEHVGEQCLNLMSYDVNNVFLLGLLQSVIEAKKRLRKPAETMKAKLKECLRMSRCEQESIQSLRVLLVKKF